MSVTKKLISMRHPAYNWDDIVEECENIDDKFKALERQLEEVGEENKLKKELISQVSQICLLLQMGKLPSQEDFKELMSLERAYRTFEEF